MGHAVKAIVYEGNNFVLIYIYIDKVLIQNKNRELNKSQKT